MDEESWASKKSWGTQTLEYTERRKKAGTENSGSINSNGQVKHKQFYIYERSPKETKMSATI